MSTQNERKLALGVEKYPKNTYFNNPENSSQKNNKQTMTQNNRLNAEKKWHEFRTVQIFSAVERLKRRA